MNKLYEKYQKEIKPNLIKEFDFKTPMRTPKLVKVVINTGLGEAGGDQKVIEAVSEQLAAITGQKPVPTKAKKSISTFKLREGQLIGVMVTLRGERMYDFVEKLFNIVLPRVRDFRGVSTESFDQGNNYSLGIREQILFPEIEYSKVDKVRGLQVTFVTSARSREEAKKLLEMLGMPFQKTKN